MGWRTEIKKFISGINIPENKPEIKKVRNQAAHYVLLEKDLYRREAKTGTFPLRICISIEGREIVKSVHKGGGGAHQGGKKLYLQISIQGYFWPTIREDTRKITRECQECQKYSDLQHCPSIGLTSLDTPVPFARWGLDIIGPFQVASGGRKYAFVAVEYFTKWADAEPVKSITQDKAVKFVFKNVICKFGVLIQIITDNGAQFAGKAMRNFCKDGNIKLSFASVHHPQTNGQVEAVNKTIIKFLKRKAGDNPKTWAYRITYKTTTNQIP